MKRHGSSDSLGGLIAEEHCRRGDNNLVYSREFQNMLDGLEEEGCHVAEKKRRLSVEQVKALEKNFEVENKLEPERKVKLAQELGLQPRQVAVWFQNRRARWKTKQLERDYGVLKANFDSLKRNHDSLKLDHDALLKQIRELKSKLGEEDGKAESFDLSVKDEIMVAESEKIGDEQEQPGTAPAIFGSSEVKDMNFTDNLGSLLPDFKDGPSDSDSSAILNDDYYKTATRSPDAAAILMSPPPSSPERSGLQFQKMYQTQFVKLEEHNFFTGDEACDFFSDEQPPSLQQWWQSS